MPRPGYSARAAATAASRTSPAPTSSDQSLPIPPSTPRADHSSCSWNLEVIASAIRNYSVGSSASPHRDFTSVAKTGKRLDFSPDSTLAPLLDPTGPDDASAPLNDAVTASAHSTVTQVAAFRRKVRVGILASMVLAVVLAVALFGSHVMSPAA